MIFGPNVYIWTKCIYLRFTQRVTIELLIKRYIDKRGKVRKREGSMMFIESVVNYGLAAVQVLVLLLGCQALGSKTSEV